MKLLGNILWYFPFFGFVSAILVYLLGLLLTATVIAAPIGLGLMEFGKFLFAPFGNSMVSKSDLNIEQNKGWKAYSAIIMVLYLPFGIFLAVCAAIQVGLLFLSIIGIPAGLVIAKSLGTYLNPVNKKCVSSAVSAEMERRKGQVEVDKYLGTGSRASGVSDQKSDGKATPFVSAPNISESQSAFVRSEQFVEKTTHSISRSASSTAAVEQMPERVNAEVSAMRFCAECGAQCEAASRFCGACGSLVAVDTLAKSEEFVVKMTHSISQPAVSTEAVEQMPEQVNAEVSAMRFCTECGEPCEVASRFCGACGSSISDDSFAETGQSQEKGVLSDTVEEISTAKKLLRRNKSGIAIGGAVIVIAGLFAYGISQFINPGARIAKVFGMASKTTDKTGRIAIIPQFDEARRFTEGLAAVRIGASNGKWGFVDKAGIIIIKPQFDWASNFGEGLASFQINETGGKYGYIDKSGAIVISPQFDFAGSFVDGFGMVQIGGKYGYIDKSGKLVINPRFDSLGDFHDGLALFRIGDKYGYIDKTGTIVINPQFDSADSFREGFAVVKIGKANGKVGFINTSGKLVINPQFEYTQGFFEGLAAIRVGGEDGKWGYIDKTGKVVISPQFDRGDNFYEGLAAVRINDTDKSKFAKDGYIDKSGAYIVNLQSVYTTGFSDDLARFRVVGREGKWGYMDRNGKTVISPQFDEAGWFFEGLAAVRIGGREGKWGYIFR